MKEILDFRTIFQYGEWFKIKIENVRSNVHKNISIYPAQVICNSYPQNSTPLIETTNIRIRKLIHWKPYAIKDTS